MIDQPVSVGAVPIREAIRRLEADSYVTFQKNQGTTVASVDARAYGESTPGGHRRN